MERLLEILQDVFLYNPKAPLLFTQFYFWAFFAIIFALFSTFHNRRLLRNTFLFFASLFFYHKTSGLFVLILVFSTFSDYFIGLLIHASDKQWRRKAWMVCSVLINLFVLSYFKYAYFYTEAFNDLFKTNIEVFNYLAHWSNSATGSNFNVNLILLPVGISFYTFQTISYSVDVYRRRIEPVRNILDFGFYVSFFPQLVAGPIVRASEFVPQLYNKFRLSRLQFGMAIFWILNGLIKKMVLGDFIAVNFIDRVFANPVMYSGFENLMALFGYSLQVYADFSGYTDIAIGVAMLMGFHLPVNFRSPYKATNPGDFWRRWHISLSSWLKDYLYIPLGGNRKLSFGSFFWLAVIALFVMALSGISWLMLAVPLFFLLIFLMVRIFPGLKKTIITNVNVMLTMLLGGLWHGASWNFMLWGGLNGAGIMIFKFWKTKSQLFRVLLTFSLLVMFVALYSFFEKPAFAIGVVWSVVIFSGTILFFIAKGIFPNYGFKWITRGWSIFLTFVFITFTRLFFRSGSNLNPAEANTIAWETASNMVMQIGSKWNTSIIPSVMYEYRKVFIMLLFGMIVHWLPERTKKWYRINFALLPLSLQVGAVVCTVFVIYQFITAELQAFIYFQF
jgi:alginate O-acetyltransferase complex protein AlgI